MQKNCANCKNSYIKDGCYLICEIDGIQNDVVENCENYEVDPDLISQLEKENKELKAKNDKLKEENDRLNRNLIEALKHEKEALDVSIKYKETLQKIKEIAVSKVKPNLVKRMNGTAKYGIDRIIELSEVEE